MYILETTKNETPAVKYLQAAYDTFTCYVRVFCYLMKTIYSGVLITEGNEI